MAADVFHFTGGQGKSGSSGGSKGEWAGPMFFPEFLSIYNYVLIDPNRLFSQEKERGGNLGEERKRHP